MYKDVLRSIAEVELFPVIGILLFMGFFLIICFYAIKMSKNEVSKLENMPFEDGDDAGLFTTTISKG